MWQEPVDGYDMHVLDPGFAECQLSKHSETHACGELSFPRRKNKQSRSGCTQKEQALS